MEEMMLMMAKLLSEQKIITDLRDAIDAYEQATSEEDKKDATSTISFHCMLFSIKKGTEKEDLQKSMSDLKRHKATVELFKDKEN